MVDFGGPKNSSKGLRRRCDVVGDGLKSIEGEPVASSSSSGGGGGGGNNYSGLISHDSAADVR